MAKGCLHVQDIAEGETIIEYVGEIISWKEAQRPPPPRPERSQPHVLLLASTNGNVIDALYGGNSSRWINHSCDGNCIADEEEGRVFIKALAQYQCG